MSTLTEWLCPFNLESNAARQTIAVCINSKGCVLFFIVPVFSLHYVESALHVKLLHKLFGCQEDDMFTPLRTAALG